MAGGIEWFRWHHGTVNDPKFQLVARKTNTSVAEVIAVWAVILEAASQESFRGNHGDLDFEAIDCALCLEDGKTSAIREEMVARGMVEKNGDITAWAKRQPKREREESSAIRVAEYRKKQRQGEPSNASVTPGNANETQKTPRIEEIREDKDKSSCDQQAESPEKRIQIPYDSIFDAYAKHLQALPQLRLFDKARKDAIRSRWNADARFQKIEFWEKFFHHVSQSDFLMNRGENGWAGCGFDWLLKPANFKKVIEGNYHHA